MTVIIILVGLAAAIFLSGNKRKTAPDFRVYDIEGQVQQNSRLVKQFLLKFTVKNTGEANATNLSGTVGYEKNGRWQSQNWFFNKPENVLNAGERCIGCYAIFWGFDAAPSENYRITVSCDEGVSRKFNVTIP